MTSFFFYQNGNFLYTPLPAYCPNGLSLMIEFAHIARYLYIIQFPFPPTHQSG